MLIECAPISVERAHLLGHRERALEQLVQRACPACRPRRPRAPPASSGRGSAARPAPSNRARWRRGRHGAPRRGPPARRCGRSSCSPLTPPLRGQPVERRLHQLAGVAVRRRRRARCGCRWTAARPRASARAGARESRAASAPTAPARTQTGRAGRAARSCGSGRGRRRSSADYKIRPLSPQDCPCAALTH